MAGYQAPSSARCMLCGEDDREDAPSCSICTMPMENGSAVYAEGAVCGDTPDQLRACSATPRAPKLASDDGDEAGIVLDL